MRVTRRKVRMLIARLERRVCVGCDSAPAADSLEECVSCWDRRTAAEEDEWRWRYNQ